MKPPFDAGDYTVESVQIHRAGSVLDILRAALQAAEELETLGVDLKDAWKNEQAFARLGRVWMLAGSVAQTAGGHFNVDNAALRQQRRKLRKSMHVVR